MMITRNAKITDVDTIYSLICDYAEHDRMLFRSKADIYENLQTFIVACIDNTPVGCCALQVIWNDLAEIKSLAVDNSQKGTGIGSAIVKKALENACLLGINKIFALTLEPDFFKKLGFEVVEKDQLPMKVWSDCAHCPKQQNCDETALIKTLS